MVLPLRLLLARLRETYWFVPAVMGFAGLGLSWLAVRADREEWVGTGALGLIVVGEAEASLNLLATMAGSIITVTGVVFSITIVTLSLASNQFGPRILLMFRRDRGTQVVLGTFIATYAYCLMALLNVGGDERVMRLTILGAALLTATSIGMLVYYIHHIAVSIQADALVSRVAIALRARIDQLYPEHPEDDDPGVQAPADRPWIVRAERDGYVQAVDEKRLLAQACKDDLMVRCLVPPGLFVVVDQPLLHCWGKRSENLVRHITVGRWRTDEGDLEAGIEQIVEIALRALSPAVNDPYMANACIDRLGGFFAVLAQRDVGPRVLSRDGKPRVILHRRSFEELLESAFGPLRQNAGTQGVVVARILRALDAVAAKATHPARHTALVQHARLVAASVDLPLEEDRRAALAESVLLRDPYGAGPSAA